MEAKSLKNMANLFLRAEETLKKLTSAQGFQELLSRLFCLWNFKLSLLVVSNL